MTMADYKQLLESKRQAMLDALLLSIEKNPKRWEKGWIDIDVPYNPSTGKNYIGLNALFLDAKAQLLGYKDPRWVTFNQAKEMGASIKDNEKASEVFYWSKYDKATEKIFESETIEGMTDEACKKYIEKNVRPVLKFYQVFNAKQCLNFPENIKRNAGNMSYVEPVRQNEQIENIIKNSSAPVFYDGKDRAYYSQSSDSIHLPLVESFGTAQDYYATVLHEIGHSTGHASRLNRDLTGSFGSVHYAIEELRLAIASVFLQSELGINLGNAEIANHAGYLKSWLAAVKKDVNVFYRAAADAGKVSCYIKDNYLKVAKQVEQVQQVEFVLPLDCKKKEYGKSTMFRLPQSGKFSSFVFLAPTKMVHGDEKVARIVVPSDFEFILKNDGREVKLTSKELSAYISGEEIGKSAQRTAPSKKNVERLEAIRTNVPDEMRAMPNWCVYRTKWNSEKGKKDKFVLSVHDGKWAKINNSDTWTDFETAYKYALENNCEGLSFALNGKGISCIDLDKCISETGEYNDLAKKLMPLFKEGYCERSASKNGLHFFVKDDLLANDTYANRGILPDGDEIEVYTNSRFISMTGDIVGKANRLDKSPTEATSYIHKVLGRKQQVSHTSNINRSNGIDYGNQSDMEVMERIRRSKKGKEFELLFSGGDITGDKSRDDLIMFNVLAFFTDCNENQMRRIFESSARFRPETKTAAYVTRSITKACDSLTMRIGTAHFPSSEKGQK